jgi:oleandomycin transport system ATP-binding protein
VLQAQPTEPTDLERTEKILAEFSAGEDPFRDDLMITVRIADRSVLGQVVRRLDDEGIVVDDLSLRRPSLDEVFLTLTGHLAEERVDDAADATPHETSQGRSNA